MHRRNLVRFGAGVFIAAGFIWALLAYTAFFATAQGPRLQYGETIDGELANASDIDTWSFDGLRGDVVAFRVTRTGGQVLPVVALTDPDGGLLLEVPAQEVNPLEMQFTVRLKDSGTHGITIASTNGAAGTYTLALTLIEPGDAPNPDNAILVYGRTASGTIDDTVYREFWTFRGTAGDVIDVQMTVVSGSLDAYVSLVAPNGTMIANSDGVTGEQNAGLYAVSLSVTGNYTVVARRTGPNSGETGTTRGDYELTVTLRTPGTRDELPTPTLLDLDMVMRGRLSADAPAALYSVETDGVLALNLDITDPARVTTVSIITPERALLHTVSGVAPLRTSITLPGLDTYWVEVSTADIRDDAPVDFALTAAQLSTATRAARPLYYNQPQIVGPDSAQPEAWYFRGTRGDLLDIALVPFGTLLEGTLSIYDPGGTLLVERQIRDTFRQSLVLENTGHYEILFAPDILNAGYAIQAARAGIAGLSFEQRTPAQNTLRFPQTPNTPASGALQPLGTDAWLLDIEDPDEWQFTLTAQDTNLPLVLAVEAPDGSWLAHGVTNQLTRTVSLQVSLAHAGRYRVLAIDLNNNDVTTYELTGYPVEGGRLAAGRDGKGVLLPEARSDMWTLDAAPGQSIMVRVQTESPESVQPDVYLIGPDGAAVRSTAVRERDANEVTLSYLVEAGGMYRVLVQQPPGNARQIYHITAHIDAPFGGPGLLADQQAPVSEVFVADITPVPVPSRVMIADLITPLIPADSPIIQAARRIETGTLIRGEIDAESRYQAWTFNANADQLLEFSVIAFDDATGPDMIVKDAEGQNITEKHTTGSNTTYMTHRFENGGSYTLLVKLDTGGRYALWVNPLNRVDRSVPVVISGQAITYGQTAHDQLLGGDDARPFVFFGRAGDAITVRTVADDSEARLQVALQNADGVVLDSIPPESAAPVLTLDSTLPEDGIYRLEVSALNPSIQAVTFALYLGLVQSSSAEAAGGLLEAPQMALLGGGAQHRWLFTAAAGAKVDLRVEPLGARGPSPLQVQIADSGGRVFAQREANLGQGAVVLEDILLPRTGVYQALVTGGQRDQGVYRIILDRDARSTHDIERPIRYGETAGKVLTAENFLDVWTFAGSAGDVVSVVARYVRGDVAPISLQLRTNNGEVLTTVASEAPDAAAVADTVTLPETGHYSIIVGNPDTAFEGEAAYEVTILLRGTAARSSGSVVEYESTVEGLFYIDDAADTWVFEGQQGDMVVARAQSQTPGLAPSLTLLSTDWHAANAAGLQVLTASEADENGTAQLVFVLPVAGTYALHVEDRVLTGGRYTLWLENDNPAAGPAVPLRLDQVRDDQIAAGNDADRWRFEAEEGMTVTLMASPAPRSNLSTALTLFGPDGETLAQTTAAPGVSAVIPAYRVPYQGAYTVQVARVLGRIGRTQGRYSVVVQQDAPPPAIAGPPLPFGDVQRGTLDNATPVIRWLFEGEAGNVIRVRLERTSGMLDPVVRVIDPQGSVIAEGDGDTNGNIELFAELPLTGRYIIETGRYHGTWGTTSGSYALGVELAYQAGEDSHIPNLVYGDRVDGSTDSENRSDFWSFAGHAGDRVYAKIQFPVDDAPLALTLRDAAGNVLATGQRVLGDVILEDVTLPANAVYTLEVRRPGDAAARFSPYTLELELTGIASPVPDMYDTALLSVGASVDAQFSSGEQEHLWFFQGRADQPVALALTPLFATLDLRLAVIAPDGTTLYEDTLGGWTEPYHSGVLVLPVDGVYLVLVQARDVVPGMAYRLLLQTTSEAAKNNVLPGENVQGSIKPGHVVQRWHFTASAGDPLAVRVSRVEGDLKPTMLITGPDGRPLAEGYADHEGQTYVDDLIAPLDGDYTIAVSRDGRLEGTTRGTYQLMLRNHAISSQAARAQPVESEVRYAGYLDGSAPQVYTFTAEAGDVVAIAVRTQAGVQPPELAVETEAGEPLLVPVITRDATRDIMRDNERYIPALWVPSSGRYVIAVSGESTTAYELAIHRRTPQPGENSVTRALGRGQPFVEGINDLEQPTYWQFSGEQGEVITLTVDTTRSALRADATLYGPGGFVANAVERDEDQTVLGPVRLPASGDYVLVVGAWLGAVGDSGGAYTVRLDVVEDGISGSDGGHILARQSPVFGGLTASDPLDEWTFTGHAGEIVTIRGTHAPTNSTMRITLLSPDGSELATSLLATAYQGVEISAIALPDDGLYTLRAVGQLADDEPVEYELAVINVESSPASPGAPAGDLGYGEVVSGTLTVEESAQTWTFYGEQGDTVRAVLQSGDTVLALRVIDAAGVTLETATLNDDVAAIENFRLPSDGFYSLITAGNDVEDPIAYTLTLWRLVPGSTFVGTLEDRTNQTLTPDMSVHEWGLVPVHSGTYAITVEAQVLGPAPDVFIASADGELLASGNAGTGSLIEVAAYLEAGERYAAVVSGGFNLVRTHYAIVFAPGSTVTGGGQLTVEQPEIGRITGEHYTDAWALNGRGGETLTLTAARVSGNLRLTLALFDANGFLLQAVEADDDGRAVLSHTLPVDGVYRVLVSRAGAAAGSTSGDYQISLGGTAD